MTCVATCVPAPAVVVVVAVGAAAAAGELVEAAAVVVAAAADVAACPLAWQSSGSRKGSRTRMSCHPRRDRCREDACSGRSCTPR